MKNRSTHTHLVIYWTYSTSQSTRRKTNEDVPTCIRVVCNKFRMRYLHQIIFSFQIPQRPKSLDYYTETKLYALVPQRILLIHIRRQLKVAFKRPILVT
jgi:hypothetical protein